MIHFILQTIYETRCILNLYLPKRTLYGKGKTLISNNDDSHHFFLVTMIK